MVNALLWFQNSFNNIPFLYEVLLWAVDCRKGERPGLNSLSFLYLIGDLLFVQDSLTRALTNQ